MNIIGNSTRREYIIPEDSIKKFEKDKELKHLEVFLKMLIKEKKQPIFSSPEQYPRFLKVIQKVNFTDEQKKSSLSFFRKKIGLPENVFENSVTLKGKDGATVSCSKQLLEMFFDYFKTALNSELRVGQLDDNEQYTIDLGLNQKTLNSFKKYVTTKRIHIDDNETLAELVNFSHMINDEPFQQAVGKAVFAYFLEDKNKTNFDRTFLEGNEQLFVDRYLEKANIKIKQTSPTIISFSDFYKLFNDKKDLELLKFLSEKIDGLIIDSFDCEIFINLHSIPKQYCKAITIIKFIGSLEICRNLISFFPNVTTEIHDKNSVAKAIQDNPVDAFAHARLGNMLRQKNRLSEAKIPLELAIALDQRNGFAYGMLGDIQRLQGQLNEAEISLAEAIDLNPKDAFAHARMGEVLRRKNQFDEAERILRRAIELNPKDAFAHCVLGNVLEKQGRFDEAESILKKAIKLNPKNPVFHVSLSEVLKRLKKHEESKESLKEADRLQPGCIGPTITFNYANIT